MAEYILRTLFILIVLLLFSLPVLIIIIAVEKESEISQDNYTRLEKMVQRDQTLKDFIKQSKMLDDNKISEGEYQQICEKAEPSEKRKYLLERFN